MVAQRAESTATADLMVGRGLGGAKGMALPLSQGLSRLQRSNNKGHCQSNNRIPYPPFSRPAAELNRSGVRNSPDPVCQGLPHR